MPSIPLTKEVLVLRTDFSDDSKWEKLITEITSPDPEFGFQPFVEFLSDSEFKNMISADIFNSLPASYPFPIIFVVDQQTIKSEESAVLCIDLHEEPGKEIRVIPKVMWAIENNLSIANCEFSSFVYDCDDDGVFRRI
jgi:hypothetical protein